MYCQSVLKRTFAVLLITAMAATAAMAERTRLKPGFNLFSPQQDIELGRQSAGEAEKQLKMLSDRRVDDYLTKLGNKLGGRAPENKGYPFQFKAVNESSINAFALPGGFLYVNRGTVEQADNEAQLAGVIGHEIGHVVLRHGTNQVSKAYLAQAPLAFLGGLGGNSIGSVLAQLGVGFGLNSLLLKYSRADERQADLVGTQIMYDCNYDPAQLARFFQKLDNQKRGSDFFSDHPNPGDRITLINGEVSRLGAHPGQYASDSSEFQQIKSYLKSLPPAPKTPTRVPSDGGNGTGGGSAPKSAGPPPPPSDRFQTYESKGFSLRYPDNWRAYDGGDGSFTLAPDGGLVQTDKNGMVLAYGFMAATTQGSARLEDSTDRLLSSLQKENPQMRVVGQKQRVRVGSEDGMSVQLTNDSPAGGKENDWVVAVLRPEGLVYFVLVAPQSEYPKYRPAFQDIVDSIKFTR
jgi:beta-barrel assembly-enhancing protease